MQRINFIHLFSIALFMPMFISAQTTQRPIFNHPLTMESRLTNIQTVAKPETSLNILAVMVEFIEDTDDRTTGKGTFDLTEAAQRKIDAPPHDIQYFENHLTFIKNYFRKVSDGRLRVTATILDSIYRLPHEMKYYSPSRNTKNNLELGYLVRDTWTVVDSISQIRQDTIPYDQFDAFIIFHAGVGRDIDLVSVYGYDPTPFDIPSLYVNLKSLQTMFGDISYSGVPVDSGKFKITNSMILPETETREEVPFPLGMNGLIAASVGSHLGLPDLFNTKNGKSGIGRFGLMDGQSIFSWNGVFPPEPSAWEKYFLGWIEPVTISSGDAVCDLPAVGLPNSNDTVYKVLISSKEYFLLENRNRDVSRDGATVTLMVGNDTTVKNWSRDTTNFNDADQDSLYGVVVDVDEFDWSLPGGYDKKADIFYDGGILIWHIDETVVENNLLTNSVNANDSRRGVNLMEADGSQDIGQNYDLLHPGSGSESGWALDFWFDGNTAPLRKNDTTGFTPTSYPSSMSNDLANSHIYINRFSERGARMSAHIKIGDDVIQPLLGFPKYAGQQFGGNSISISNLPDGAQAIIIAANGLFREDTSIVKGEAAIFGWRLDGSPILSTGYQSGLLTRTLSLLDSYSGKIASGKFNSDSIIDITIGTLMDRAITMPPFPPLSSIDRWSIVDQNNDHEIDRLPPIVLSRRITTSPVVSDSFIAYGAEGGMVYFVKTLDSLKEYNFDTSDVVGLSLWNQNSAIAVTRAGTVGIIKTQPEVTTEVKKDFGRMINTPAVTGNISSSAGKCIAFASQDGYLYLIDGSLNILQGFPVYTGGEILNSPGIADIDGDGQKDVVVFSGDKIYAINASGAILDNFPIPVSTSYTLRTSPIVADLDGNGTVDIITVTVEGLVVAYDRTGRMVRGFPLLTGGNGASTPAAFYLLNSPCGSCVDIGLAVASDDGTMYAWKTGSMITGLLQPPVMPWPQYLHDAQNTGLVEDVVPSQPRSSQFFPASLAYNWPNPVSASDGFITHIRYFVHDNANIHIKIYEPAGDLVTEFDGPGIGGLDNEVEWNVSGVQSGIYFAHIEASGAGQSGTAIIKIAVVK